MGDNFLPVTGILGEIRYVFKIRSVFRSSGDTGPDVYSYDYGGRVPPTPMVYSIPSSRTVNPFGSFFRRKKGQSFVSRDAGRVGFLARARVFVCVCVARSHGGSSGPSVGPSG